MFRTSKDVSGDYHHMMYQHIVVCKLSRLLTAHYMIRQHVVCPFPLMHCTPYAVHSMQNPSDTAYYMIYEHTVLWSHIVAGRGTLFTIHGNQHIAVCIKSHALLTI